MVSSTLPELAGSPGREIRRSCLWFRYCDSCVRNPAFGLALHPVPRFGAAVCLEGLTGAPIPSGAGPLFCSLFLSGLLVYFSPSVSLPLAQSCRLRERGARVAFSRGSLPAGRRRPPWSEGSLCVPRRGSMLPSPTAGQIDSGNSRAITRASPWKDQGQRGSCAPLGALVSQTSRRMTQAPHQVPRLTAGFPQG